MMQLRNKKIALIGIMVSCGILFGYIEFLLPLPIGIPGVKLGLANIMTLICLYCMGYGEALAVLILRVLISGFLFGNMFGLIYSLSGALLAYLMMLVCKKSGLFSIYGVAVSGGVFHNIGQLLVASIIISELKLVYYIPVLMVSGLICGLIVGFLSDVIIRRTNRIFGND